MSENIVIIIIGKTFRLAFLIVNFFNFFEKKLINVPEAEHTDEHKALVKVLE